MTGHGVRSAVAPLPLPCARRPAPVRSIPSAFAHRPRVAFGIPPVTVRSAIPCLAEQRQRGGPLLVVYRRPFARALVAVRADFRTLGGVIGGAR